MDTSKASLFSVPAKDLKMDKLLREKEVILSQVGQRRQGAYEMLKVALIEATNLLSDSADILKEEGVTSKTTPLFEDIAERFRFEVELADRLWKGEIR